MLSGSGPCGSAARNCGFPYVSNFNADLRPVPGITLDLLEDEGWQVDKSRGKGLALGNQP